MQQQYQVEPRIEQQDCRAASAGAYVQTPHNESTNMQAQEDGLTLKIRLSICMKCKDTAKWESQSDLALGDVHGGRRRLPVCSTAAAYAAAQDRCQTQCQRRSRTACAQSSRTP